VVFSKAVLLKSGPSVSAQRKRLSAGLIDLLVRRYPLRGRILTADRRGLKIDIGTDAGVRPGQVFQTVKGGLRLPVAAVMPARSLLRPPPEDPLPETGARIVCADK
jgi:hypothetical protein